MQVQALLVLRWILSRDILINLLLGSSFTRTYPKREISRAIAFIPVSGGIVVIAAYCDKGRAIKRTMHLTSTINKTLACLFGVAGATLLAAPGFTQVQAPSTTVVTPSGSVTTTPLPDGVIITVPGSTVITAPAGNPVTGTTTGIDGTTINGVPVTGVTTTGTTNTPIGTITNGSPVTNLVVPAQVVPSQINDGTGVGTGVGAGGITITPGTPGTTTVSTPLGTIIIDRTTSPTGF